jgi:hypothetical protein|tara:strand:- start:388 stop:708 length:321 start_codon:yes stop_codon:yes gene_type:complete
MSDEKTYRSYGVTKLDDNFRISLNIKWLGQIIIGVAFVVLGYLRIENRLAELERRMELADSKILELVEKNQIEEQKTREAMEERISFFEQELNLNPFSWKKSKRKK